MPFLLVQSLSSDLEGKVAEVATKVNKSGKSINDHDKEVVLAVCGYREKKDQCLRFLKRNGSEQEELPTVGVDYDYEVTSWLTSLSKK
jgi:lysine/ornithine N-monooxygenase